MPAGFRNLGVPEDSKKRRLLRDCSCVFWDVIPTEACLVDPIILLGFNKGVECFGQILVGPRSSPVRVPDRGQK